MPEVRDVGSLFLAIEQNVPRLEVAMKNASLMGVMNRARDQCHQPDCLARALPELGHVFSQSSAACELHAIKGTPFVFAGLVERQNVWMIEGGNRLGFRA